MVISHKNVGIIRFKVLEALPLLFSKINVWD